MNHANDNLTIAAGVSNRQGLLDAAENVLIAYGMGWDMDGVIENLAKAAAAARSEDVADAA